MSQNDSSSIFAKRVTDCMSDNLSTCKSRDDFFVSAGRIRASRYIKIIEYFFVAAQYNY